MKNKEEKYPLRGKIICLLCGCKFSTFSQKRGDKVYRYYRCQGYKKKICNARKVNADKIEKEVKALILQEVDKLFQNKERKINTLEETFEHKATFYVSDLLKQIDRVTLDLMRKLDRYEVSSEKFEDLCRDCDGYIHHITRLLPFLDLKKHFNNEKEHRERMEKEREERGKILRFKITPKTIEDLKETNIDTNKLTDLMPTPSHGKSFTKEQLTEILKDLGFTHDDITVIFKYAKEHRRLTMMPTNGCYIVFSDRKMLEARDLKNMFDETVREIRVNTIQKKGFVIGTLDRMKINFKL